MNKLILVFILNIAICSNLLAVYVPIEENTIETIEELGLRGYNLLPYPDIKGYFITKSTIESTNIPEWAETRLTQPLFRLKISGDSINVTKTSIFIPYERPPVSIIVEPIIKFGNENVWPKEKFKDKFAADYERAFLKLNNSSLEFLIGRERVALGPSTRYNLLLSGYSPPLDLISYAYTTNKFKLYFLFSKLDNIQGENFVGDTIHNDTINARRFMSLRRLEINPYKKLNIGLSEAVIYGGENAIPDLYYLNPVALSYPYEFINKETDHNILWDVDARFNFNAFTIYGEFLMDDFQYGKDEQGEPNHIGMLAGMRGIDLFGVKKVFWQAEYVRVSRWAYNHYHPWQRFKHLGYPLGHPLGPDFDEVVTKLTYHFKPDIDLHTSISSIRKGSATVDDIWPISESPRTEGQKFPTNNFLLPNIRNYFDIKAGTSVLKDIANLQTKIDFEIGAIKADKKITTGFTVNTSLNIKP